ncbi:TPA: fumarylacetoacetate hydrolase family protein [Klebsiella pneumoniae subsp. pneumoniae]|nr:fumarylacetoacetate hydrolase family protein [Klebsiella pneumoniae subsp. pneumoniae]
MKGTIFAVALNHRSQLDAWREAFQQAPYKTPPKTAVWFIKPRNTVIGDGEAIPSPQGETVQSGATVALIVGKTARRVSEAEAMDYVAGYTVCNDYAIRDYLENYYRPNLRVKSRDTLTPIGPWIVSKEAIPDPHNLALRTWVNGELRQQGTTADLIFSIPFLIAYLSEFMTLQPGDMIATGTPKGLSDVVPGDEVIVEVEGVGRLVNHIISQQAYEETLS